MPTENEPMREAVGIYRSLRYAGVLCIGHNPGQVELIIDRHMRRALERVQARADGLKVCLDNTAAENHEVRELLLGERRENARLRGVLREVEWGGEESDRGERACPGCYAPRPVHNWACPIGRALAGEGEAVKPTQLLQEMRDIAGEAWGKIDDPDAYIRELRGEEESDD